MPPLDPTLSFGPRSYARVALNRPLAGAYTYFVPESLTEHLRLGSLVEVPLRTETAAGVVVELLEVPDIPPARIKPIRRQLTPEYHVDGKVIELALWVAEYYACAPGEALAAASMIGLNHVTTRQVSTYTLANAAEFAAQLVDWRETPRPDITDPEDVESANNPDDRDENPTFTLPNSARAATAQQSRVITELLEAPHFTATAEDLREQAGVSASVLATLEKRGILVRQGRDEWREDDDTPAPPQRTTPHELTAEQRLVFETLRESLNAATYAPALLHGVTGSGKTEIYLRLIAEALTLGRTAIVLVPEISLTPQLVDAFRGRLGPVVGVFHSKLTLGQKFDLWRKIQLNEIRVVIGARSAIFAALPGLGVIIVDEEHEASYKQGETPRYHGRDVAVMRARRAEALILLGSATPSVESLHNAREGKYAYLQLPNRISPHPPPRTILIDMRRHLPAPGDPSGANLISPPLREAIHLRLTRGEQTVLLLNRRGYANHVICLRCETALMCPHCSVAFTWHKQGQRLQCHWCGERQPLPRVCPACGAGELHTLGLGTQRIEEVLAALFPDAKSLRIDVDAMRRRGAFQQAWQAITSGRVDIIFGTQMIAKGLHLERVTLVGVISADFALFLPDFRAGERTWSLLTQVAGRAGRGELPGEVMVQTWVPHHEAIELAASGDADAFYEKELKMRRVLRFPPFARLIALILSGPDPDQVRAHADALYNQLAPLALRPDFKTIKVFNATPAPLHKLNDQFRWRLLLRGPQVRPLHDLLHSALAAYHKHAKKNQVQLTIDVDPLDLL